MFNEMLTFGSHYLIVPFFLMYADTFNVEQLEDVDVMNDWSRSWGVTYFYENDYMLTHKTKK